MIHHDAFQHYYDTYTLARGIAVLLRLLDTVAVSLTVYCEAWWIQCVEWRENVGCLLWLWLVWFLDLAIANSYVIHPSIHSSVHRSYYRLSEVCSLLDHGSGTHLLSRHEDERTDRWWQADPTLGCGACYVQLAGLKIVLSNKIHSHWYWMHRCSWFKMLIPSSYDTIFTLSSIADY